MKKIALFVSSFTGNTRKIADAICNSLIKNNYDVTLQDSRHASDDIPEADLYIVCFWCRRTGLDDISKKIVDKFHNTPILAVGTCGHYPDSDYSNRIRANVKEYINQNNSCIDIFLSQGAVSLEKTMRRRNLPKSSPHYLNDEAYERHLESQNHPNEIDCLNAITFVKQYL